MHMLVDFLPSQGLVVFALPVLRPCIGQLAARADAVRGLAGGGLRTGQVIGATDRVAGEVIDRPVRFEEVHATLYDRLGIDVKSTVVDLAGRPHSVTDHHPPLRELV